MTKSEQWFELASLAQASYAFPVGLADDALRDAIRADQNDGFGERQALRIIGQSGFSAVSHQPNDSHGFSATLFRDNRSTDEYTLAIRGSEGKFPEVFLPTAIGNPDWSDANRDILDAFRGAARNQIVSAANYFRKILAPTDTEVSFYRLVDTAEAPSTGSFYQYERQILPISPLTQTRYVYLQFDHAEFGLGVADTPIRMTGHSLGGHIAMALARLFPDRITQVTTFNAAGFQQSTSRELDLFFNLLGGAFGTPLSAADFPNDRIENVFAYNGPEIVTNTAVFRQPGTRIGLFIEGQTDSLTGLHSIARLSDSLALQSVLAEIDASLDQTQLNRLMEAFASDPAATLELGVAALLNLYKGSRTDIAIGQRDQYYARLFEVRDAIAALPASLEPLAGMSTTALIDLAKSAPGLPYRYALKELNPFVVHGPISMYDDSSAHNANGELNRYVDATSTFASMTDEYIVDRAAFLVAKGIANVNDLPSAVIALQSDTWRYSDLGSRYQVTVFGTAAPTLVPRMAIFGGDSADLVKGAENADRLYGGMGTDLLTGEAGDDYLEGGRGRDVYQLNGYRSLTGNLTNDGADEVRDTDGQGHIRYQFIEKGLLSSTTQSTFAGGVALKISDTEWVSPDGKFSYKQQFVGLNVVVNGDAGGSVRILDFDYAKARSEGYLGIRLIDAPVAPQTERTIAGDFVPFDSDPGQEGVQTVLDDLGNVQLTNVPEPGRIDFLNDSSVSDLIVSGAGNDVITISRGGNDLIRTGAGRDEVHSTSGGKDYVEAGGNTSAGGDIVFTGDGEDTVFAEAAPADFRTAFTALIDPNLAGSGLKGDFISTGAGDDVAFGASDNDVLAGGGGADILLGGGGNDYLLGDSRYQAETFEWAVTRQFTGNYPVPDFAAFSGVPAITDDPLAGNDALYGGAGDDWLGGGGGNDYLDAGSGNDFAFGDVGDDVVIGGAGADVLDGDVAGLPDSLGGNDVIDGGAGNDFLFGRGGDDLLFGSDGSDTIEGGSGDDVIVGGAGNDTIRMGTGKDVYFYNEDEGTDRIEDPDRGADALVLSFGEGIERESVSFGIASLFINLGNGDGIHIEGFDGASAQNSQVLDRIEFADGDVMTWDDVLAQGFELAGTNSADFISGTSVNDRIDALGGDDVVSALSGDDVVNGGAGNDFVFAGSGNDTVLGEAGDDFLNLDAGDDVGVGGDGTDQISGGAGNDTLEGGSGDDLLSGEEDADRYVFARGAGRDTVSEQGTDSTLEFRTTTAGGLDASAFTVTAEHDSSGAAELTLDYGTTAGVDQVRIGKGLSTIASVVFVNADAEESETLTVEDLIGQAIKPVVIFTGDDGNDEIDGGFAADTLAGGAGDDTLYAWWGDDVLSGGVGRDRLFGDRGDDRLFGEAGNDTLEGGDGNDILAGGVGANVLRGGAGSDEYVLEDGATQLIEEDAGAGIETIRLAAGRSMEELTAYRVGNDLALKSLVGDAAAYVKGFFVPVEGKQWVLAGDLEAPRDLAEFVAERLGSAGNEEAARSAFKVSLEADLLQRGTGGESLGRLNDFRNGFSEFDIDAPGFNAAVDYGFAGVTTNAVSAEGEFLLPDSESEARERHVGSHTRTETYPVYTEQFVPGNVWTVTVPTGGSVPHPHGSIVTALGGGQYQIEEPGSYRSVQTGVQQVTSTFTDVTHSVDRSFTLHEVSGTEEADRISVVETTPNGDVVRAFRGTVNAGAGDDTVDLGGRGGEDVSIEWLGFDPQPLGLGAFVSGGAGNDTLYGTAADDVLYGGEGSDFMDGGRGADTYYALFQGEDTDVIYDKVDPGGAFFGFGYGGVYPRDTLVFEPGITPATLSYALTEESEYDGRKLVEISSGGASRLRVVFSDPIDDDAGESSVGIERFRFADGVELTREEFLEQVAHEDVESNEPPVANVPIADQAALEDAPFAFQVPSDAFVDPDSGDTLTLSATLGDGGALPAWLAFDAQAQTFSGTPAQADVGQIAVVVFATDAAGAYAWDEFTIEVANANDAPTVAQALVSHSFEAGVAFTFTMPAGSFADEDPGDTLTFTAGTFGGNPLPAWLAFDAATGTFSGTPGAADIGISRLEVTATDAAGAQTSSDFGLIVHAAAGSSVTGGAGDDVIHGAEGDETLIARGGSDYLNGDAGNDLLRGGGGNDVLQGGEGADVLRGGNGQNLLDGGAGDDLIYGGQGAGLISGGAGNDTLRVGRGNDVIVFNSGDGMDTVYGGRDGGNTLSFGGGIRYSDLSLERDGRDLVVHAGDTEGVRLRNWYSGNRSVANLQLVLDTEYDQGSPDALFNRRVQSFDFLGMVGAYDQARAENPGVSSWALTNALLQYHLAAADDAALGGDLAYWYGRTRSFAGLSLAAAQATLGAPGFGADAQALHPFAGLQEGFVKLG